MILNGYFSCSVNSVRKKGAMFLPQLRNAFKAAYSKRYLPITNTVTGVIFFGTGDYAVQRLVEKRPSQQVDYKRIGKNLQYFVILDKLFSILKSHSRILMPNRLLHGFSRSLLVRIPR